VIEAVDGATVKPVSLGVLEPPPQPLKTKPMNIAKNTNVNRRGFQFMTPPQSRANSTKQRGEVDDQNFIKMGGGTKTAGGVPNTNPGVPNPN
jgi:hypothetical protein